MKHFEIEIQKLNYIYDNLLSGLIAVPLLSAILFYSYYGIVDTKHLYIWFVSNLIVILFRAFLLSSYRKATITQNNFLFYYKTFFVLASLTAFLWGSGAFFIFPSQVEYQIIILLFVAGLISGVSVNISLYNSMFITYLLLSLVPYIYVFFMQSSDISLMLSTSLFLYMLILYIIGKKISLTIEKNFTLASKLEIKVEEANSANKAKSEFLSIMSHEIRTPLNAIMGFVQILKYSEKDEKKWKYLDTIDNSSKVLTNVINDILDITKIEAGKLILEEVEFNTQEEFHTIYTLFEQNCIEKDIRLINSISPNIPNYLKSDIMRIKQIVSNLLSNAIKFTEENKNIELIINYDDVTATLYIEVKDEGIGISEKNIEKITESFTQADSSTARKYGGTGLGLSIVTQLLALFKSELKIQSSVGKGSSFSFEIIAESCESPTKDEVSKQKTLFDGKKILVAEDNKTNQMLIEILLEDLNIETTIAADGLIAEELYQQGDFDLVLMDINMPNKNGTEAMLEIKAVQQIDKKEVPIIALTANAVSGDREKYLNLGFDDYLSKPIENDMLLKVLNKYL